MKLEEIIRKLNEINKELNNEDINSLVERLTIDLKESIALKKTPKVKLNAIKRVLNNKKVGRPILKKYDIQNGKMVFTDSYEAFRITDLEDNPFDKVTDKDGVYPNLDNVFPKNYDSDNTITFDYKEVKAFVKTHKEEKEGIKLNDNYMINPKFIINTLEIMPDDTIYYKLYNVGDRCIIYGLSMSTGDDCLLLPMKVF